MTYPFHHTVAEDFAAVDQLIKDNLSSNVPLVEEISAYLIGAGGKRLRPLLVLLCARACGYQGKDHIKLAAVIEFLHTAMLLHDDVVDESDLRRGRKTVNSTWGNPASVLVGDFLHSRAFEMMVEIGNLRVMEILSHATNTIAEGEVQQLSNIRNPDLTEESYTPGAAESAREPLPGVDRRSRLSHGRARRPKHELQRSRRAHRVHPPRRGPLLHGNGHGSSRHRGLHPAKEGRIAFSRSRTGPQRNPSSRAPKRLGTVRNRQ